MAAASRKHGKRPASGITDAPPRQAVDVDFRGRVAEALSHFGDPAWLGRHSVLATPYLLDDAGASAGDDPEQRGHALQRMLLSAAHALPAAAGAYDPRRLLDAAFFHPNPARTNEGIAVNLALSPATYYRHRDLAVADLGETLIRRLRPSLRFESPPAASQTRAATPDMVGRAVERAGCERALQAGQLAALTGPSGMGKTTLAASIAGAWPDDSRPFWYTIRPGFNDHLQGLLFSLGHFLFQRGAPRLWKQLVAQPGRIDPQLALGLTREDLAAQTRKPLLCIDEIDLLRPQDSDSDARIQLRGFVEALAETGREDTPALFIGQQLLTGADAHYVLSGLAPADIEALLAQHGVTLGGEDAARLRSATRGNPLLLTLFAALHQLGEPVGEALRLLPASPSFTLLLDRIQRRLTPDERAVLIALAPYRGPAPQLAAGPPAALAGLLARGLAQQDERGGVALQGALREALLRALSAEERARVNRDAARVRAAHGEYTAAAQHYLDAGQPAQAVRLWAQNRVAEIDSGQSGIALAMFRNLSRDMLAAPEDRQALALLRAELLRAQGENTRALEDLDGVPWAVDDPVTPYALRLRGDLLDDTDQTDAAQMAYQTGLGIAASQLAAQPAQLRVRLGRLQMRRFRDLGAADHEAALAEFESTHLRGDIADERGDFNAAHERFSQALDLATRASHAFGIARAQASLGVLASRTGNHAAALAHFEHALSGYMQIGERARAEQARTNVAFAHIMARDYDAALAPAGQALAFFERSAQAYWVAVNAVNLAEAHLRLGQHEAAEQRAMQALAQEEPGNAPYALFVIGEIRRAQGRLEQAEAALRDVIRLARQGEDRFAEAPAWRALGQVLRARQSGDAVAAFAQAGELYRALGMPAEVLATEHEARR